MPGLNLKNLGVYRDEILKAEIISYFSLIEKTFADWWKDPKHGSYFKNSSTTNSINIGNEIENLLNALKSIDLCFNKNININTSSFQINSWDDFINNNWRNWRDISLKKDNKKVLQVLFGSCEGLNSGVEKGFPKDGLHIKSNEPYFSNSYGTMYNAVIEDFIENIRSYLFSIPFNKNDLKNKIDVFWTENFKRKSILNKYKISELKNNIPSNNIKELLDLIKNFNVSIDIRNEFLKNFAILYCFIPSDSRFPANDTSLFDQAFMSAALFKSKLSEILLKYGNIPINEVEKHREFKWRILGIQYDKLGLAEKGYKPQQIQWYREISREIDDEIKTLLEYEYPIGNEIYRDETGIYFLVGEDLGEDLNDDSNLARLKSELKEIEEKIMGIFKTKSIDEFYPAIFLTKSSRGLMNLSYLLEKAKENFLKANWSKKKTDICIEKSESGRAIGICQVCRQRLVFKSDKSNEDKIICNTCYREKTQGRIDKWLENIGKETIWMDELKDKNGKVALVTMKFELHDWLNGDMLNSLLVREENFNEYLDIIKELLNLIKNQLFKDELKSLDISNAENNIKKFLSLYDENVIFEPFEKIFDTLKNNGSINNVPAKYKDLAQRLLNKEDWLENFSFFDKQSKIVTINKKTNNKKSIQDYLNNDGAKSHLYKVFAINYLILQIYNTLLERSIGDRWEEFIKQKLGNKIDFKYKKIYWQNLTDDDIDFLSTLILQFLLRKNPSPARLRRIWESTREFFEDIKINLVYNDENLIKIPKWRRGRILLSFKCAENIQEGIYESKGVQFYKPKNINTLYLISSIEEYLKAFKPEKLKEIEKKTNEIKQNTNKSDDEKINEILKIDIDENDVELINITIKSVESNNEYDLDITGIELVNYQPYMSIIDPTPISWQFIIPAEYVPNLIENVMEKYYRYFKFVYGKLPLHIGVVVQDYKQPLYVGIKALRRIRRDVADCEKLEINIEKDKVERKIRKYQIKVEEDNDSIAYYSLYWGEHSNKDYEFYIKPDDKYKRWIASIRKNKKFRKPKKIEKSKEFKKINKKINKKITIIPNTFDFEFLDTNTRRNEIYYDKSNKWKRKVPLKSLRPYDLETWEKFKKFKELFSKENRTGVARSTRLQKMISVIYNKLEDLRDIESAAGKKTIADINNEGIKAFLSASFINILKLKEDKELAEGIKKLFDIDKSGENDNLYRLLKEKMTLDNLQFFLDMYEFWHKAIGEV
ncbi:CRISPR-associated protein, Csx11 family [Caldicellulosiruptor acetigenus I77R1B]|uniref:CRISPR-associated protein, Csx11 family n=1 Tax=Caldicellulosiruptor acetigenus (strain ATCC 700853 / DSM 12137 / I77R1B) TaxID=632335 RepID=E4S8Y1_CALA7|nr:CRISPR-associated protein Csx11 [Caldicellulosiruptor acetigenus]ADQ41986.1 CRISPR-associated protein, Csx11 family [Caldicellulosiruptor acetigenus I77R1B]